MSSGHPPPPGAPQSATATSRPQIAALLAPLRGRLAVLLAAVFAIDAMTGLVVIAFGNSYLIETRHAPASYPAYALGIYGLVKLLAAPIGGRVLDHVRAGFIVLCVVAIELLGLGIILGTASANGFLAGIAFLSAGIAIAWLIVFHALGDASAVEMRAAATSYLGLTSAIATGTGFGIAAVVGATPYWPAAFFVAIVFAVASGGLLARLYPFGGHIGRLQGHTRTDRPIDRRAQVISATIVFAHFVAVTATIAAFGPFVLRVLGLTLLRAGILLIPAAAAAALGMFLAGRWSRHGNRLRDIALLYLLGAVAVLAAAAVETPWVFAVIAVPLALSIGGAQPLLNASVLDVSQSAEQTGTALGWLFFAEGLGSVAGPAAIGLIIFLLGVREAVVAISILDGLIVVLALAGSRATRPRAEDSRGVRAAAAERP